MDKNNQAWVWTRYHGIIEGQEDDYRQALSSKIINGSMNDSASVKIPALLLGALLVGLLFPTIAILLSLLTLILMAWNLAELQFREMVQTIPFKNHIFNGLERINEFLST